MCVYIPTCGEDILFLLYLGYINEHFFVIAILIIWHSKYDHIYVDRKETRSTKDLFGYYKMQLNKFWTLHHKYD